MSKVSTVSGALRAAVKSGDTILVGGFGRGGVPFSCTEFLADHPDEFRDLTLVKNDANEPGLGIGAMFRNPGQVKKLISTHIGLNPEFIGQMNAKEIACELIPQGIFAEKLRAGGAGIPAFLHDIGMGTIVAEGKRTVDFDGRPWILESALRGDVGLLCADMADEKGNAWWRGTNRNMNVVMGMAARTVIVEAKQIVPVGTLRPEDVHLPGVCVTAVVPAGPRRHLQKLAADE
ncbi:MAG: CoA transferase subunit A [Sumerlaeia bacterium]